VKVWFSHIEAENEVMRSIAEEFTGETGIQVDIVSRRTVFDAPADLVNNAELPDRPDVIFMQAPDIGGLVVSGYLLPLEVGQEICDRFVEVAFKAFSYQGKVYGIGYSVDTSGLLYNKALISPSELPKTWDSFFSAAKSLTLFDDDGKAVRYGTRLNPKDMWFNYPIIREYGGYYFGTLPDGTYNAYDIGLDNESMQLYVERMKKAMEENLTITNPNHTESHISYEFARGKVAMILYGLWNAQIYQNMGVDYGIAMLPRHRDGSVSRPLSTVQGFVMNRFTERREEATAFLTYLLRDENQQRLIEAGNRGSQKTGERNPANIAVISSAYVQSDEILTALAEIGKYSEPFPNIPEGPIWYNYTPTAFRTIFFGNEKKTDSDTEQHLKALADKIRSDVASMNENYEPLRLSWRFWICFLGTIFVGFCLWFLLRKKKIHAAYHEKPSRRETLLAWLLLTPLILLLTVFYLYPIVHNIYLSLTNYSGINLRDYQLIGFANYRQIFSTQIAGLISLTLWTVSFAVMVVGFSFLLATLFASLLDRIGFSIARIYRVIFILPWVIPAVITLLMWQGLLETEGGFVNQLLGCFGFPVVPWLSHPVWAKVSVVLVMIWFSFPYFMVIVQGLLKTIPKSFYDVARIEGANGYHVFTKITLPWVFRAMLPMLIMGLIMQFNQFGVYLLTQGGPAGNTLGAPGATDLLITYVFNTAFNTKRYAMAASYSVVIFFFVGGFALSAMIIGKRRMEGESS
jgi:arabinogalactan oligomer/maltooligosaccharide transport system permease protein